MAVVPVARLRDAVAHLSVIKDAVEAGQLISVADFRALASDGDFVKPGQKADDARDVKVYRCMPTTLETLSKEALAKALDGIAEEDRGGVAKFRLSNADVDREGDSIATDGWVLEHYIANAVVLWAHLSKSPPIGQALSVGVEDGWLKAVDMFTPASFVPPAPHLSGDFVFRMLVAGFLNAVSVGFLPLLWGWNEERGGWAIDFMKQELLEHSVVPIPAHRGALQEASAEDIRQLDSWAEACLDGAAPLPLGMRSTVEAVRRETQPAPKGRAVALPSGVTLSADDLDVLRVIMAPPEPVPEPDTKEAETMDLAEAIAAKDAAAIRKAIADLTAHLCEWEPDGPEAKAAAPAEPEPAVEDPDAPQTFEVDVDQLRADVSRAAHELIEQPVTGRIWEGPPSPSGG